MTKPLAFGPDGLRPVLLTADDFVRMAEMGMFVDFPRLELVDGRLVQMASEGAEHMFGVRGFLRAIENGLRNLGLQERFVLQPHGTLVVSDERVFEPDLMVLEGATRETIPDVATTRLVIEIADTSRARDMGAKRDAYAAGGFADYWVHDVVRRELIVHRAPRDGAYQEITPLGPEASVAPLFAPELRLALEPLL